MNKSLHFLVSGRVQGVFFRMKTKQQAIFFSLTGWIRNLADGRVEGIVSGEENKLEDFRQWLQKGPELAQILKVEFEYVPLQAFEEFSIR